VLKDAEALASGGVHGLMLENFGDVPFFPESVGPATVSQLTWLAAEVRRQFDLPLGINVLPNDGLAALSIAAAVGGSFIRVNVLAGARLTDQGLVCGNAAEILRLRGQLETESIRILADVAVKHSAPLAPQSLAAEAADLVERSLADGLIVTGTGTGRPAAAADLREVKAAAAGAPVLIGSGVTPETAASWAGIADGLIVGSSLKVDGILNAPVDPARVRKLLRTLD
jgi:membrane complex biogenesis BtpA family protein